MRAWSLLVCPRCRGEVEPGKDRYLCGSCGSKYPIVAGIPDFRVAADPWIGLEEDREKALRLAERVQGCDLAEAVRIYWDMTPHVSAERAARFTRHVLAADRRSEEWISTWDTSGAGAGEPDPLPWLDLGCGTGDFAVAASRRRHRVVAADIALRWLVVARCRPELAEGRAELVCCGAEKLPFRGAAFGCVASLGLMEHCRDPRQVLEESVRVLRPGGWLRLRTVQRYSLLREPHVGVWGVGFLPRAAQDRYVRWRSRGERGYRHHRPLSPRELRRCLRSGGLRQVRVTAARPLETETEGMRKALLTPYTWVRRRRILGWVVSWVAPLLEAEGRRVIP